MKRRLSIRVFTIAAGLLAVLVLVVLVSLFLAATTPEAVQQQLAEAAAGAGVEFDQVERLWIAPGLRLRGLRLNAAECSVESELLEVRLAVASLLFGRVELDRISLRGGVVTLESTDIGLPNLPWKAAWEMEGVAVRRSFRGGEEEILYVERLALPRAWGSGRSLTLLARPSATSPGSLELNGRVRGLGAGSSPEGEGRLRLAQFPLRPALRGVLSDEQLPGGAELSGTAEIQRRAGVTRAEGELQLSAPVEGRSAELVSTNFRFRATADRLAVERLSGRAVGNVFELSGEVADWLGPERKATLAVRLPDVRWDEGTRKRVAAVLGTRWGSELTPLENLEGRWAAHLRVRPAKAGHRWSGEIELRGLRYQRPGVPAIERIEGSLRLDEASIYLVGIEGRFVETPVRLAGAITHGELDLELSTDPIPLDRLPVEARPFSEMRNLHGLVSVEAKLSGPVQEAELSGTATLVQAGLDYGPGSVSLRDFHGEADFDLTRVRFEQVQGQVDTCLLELTGSVEPQNWRHTLRLQGQSVCTLPELIRTARRAGLEAVSAPMLDSLNGLGRLQWEYAKQQWHGSVEIADGSWQPAWLGQDIEAIAARVTLRADTMEIQGAGRVGQSPLQWEVRRTGAAAEVRWEGELTARLEPSDAEALLPSRWRGWLRIPRQVNAQANLSGSPATGLRIEAHLETPGQPTLNAAAPSTVLSVPASHQIELKGIWHDQLFELDQLSARLATTTLEARGRVGFSSPHPYFDLRFEIPSGSALPPLLEFLRLPKQLSSADGAMGADVVLRGSSQQPELAGTVTLEQVHLPQLLTQPVELTGTLRLSSEEAQFEEFTVSQPLGSFQVRGTLRHNQRSELTLTGGWLNLDRLLGQLPGSGLQAPSSDFFERHPWEVTVALERVQYVGVVLEQVRAQFLQEQGLLALREGQFWVGPGEGTLAATIIPGNSRVDARLELLRVPVERLLVDVLKREPTVRAPLSLRADLSGPVAAREEFLQRVRGEVQFHLGHGRIARGTLPERLFALAVLLDEGVYGFSLTRLFGTLKPPSLRRFREWTGTIELEDGKAAVVSTISSKLYDLTFTGELELASGEIRLHAEGDYHPGREFHISLKSIVNTMRRMLHLGGHKKGRQFSFDVGGTLTGRKSVDNFQFKD